jgi:NADPH:quinone reductase-like Zn-dependent oxidoreductase
MKKAVADRIATEDLASVISVIDAEPPAEKPGWTLVRVKAVSLNQHDLWTIKGVGVKPEQFPIGIGSDIAGVTVDGREVVVHPLFATLDRPGGGSELLDPRRSMLAEAVGGGAAEWVLVPDRNIVTKPAALGFVEAAALPTAWLTAYHMLFSKAKAKPGQTVLVQGAGGGVATAAIAMASAAGLRVFVAGRDKTRLARALELGASAVYTSGERLPERVDIVIETVGTATFDHSLRSVRPGGVLVVAGGTSGGVVTFDLNKIFLQHISIVGSSLGTIEDFTTMVNWIADAGIQPTIDSTFPLEDAVSAVARLESGDAVGKIIITP